MRATLERNWWVIALRGILAVLCGLAALAWPAAAVLTLIAIVIAYLLVDGVLAIISGWRAAQRHERWWPFALEGVADLIAGIFALLVPGAAALALVWLFAAWAIVTGILVISGGWRLVGVERWLLVVAGLISIVLGLVIIAQPLAGLIGLITLFAVYLLAFGVLLLVFAFRVRTARPAL
jgi:uncharacterized membrane protein HdeD (DUF308 family)